MTLTDDELLSALRTRVMAPLARVDVKVLPAPPLYPPATPGMIASTEAAVGFSLHPFLKRIYTEVANGGFGPGYGLVGTQGGYRDAEGSSLSATYVAFRSHGWPEKLLPLWDWGDAIWSCIDNDSIEGAIVTHDDAAGPTLTTYTLRSWLSSWLGGVDLWKEIYEDKTAAIINPFTQKPIATKIRGAARGTAWHR